VAGVRDVSPPPANIIPPPTPPPADPRITDYDLLLSNIRDLKDGAAVDVPIYDFKASRRVGYRRVGVPESRVVILEGIYALSQRLRPLLDLRVSITGGVHFDLIKRVLRDIDRTGFAPEDIIQQVRGAGGFASWTWGRIACIGTRR
jgi:uridine kinase